MSDKLKDSWAIFTACIILVLMPINAYKLQELGVSYDFSFVISGVETFVLY